MQEGSFISLQIQRSSDYLLTKN